MYFEKEAITDYINIPLPIGEEEFLECDHTFFFPDGSQIHITGIERSERNDISYSIESWGVVANEIHYWQYRPVLHGAYTNVTASNNAFAHNSLNLWKEESTYSFYFEVSGNDMPEYITVQFYNPIYYLDEVFTFDITLQE